MSPETIETAAQAAGNGLADINSDLHASESYRRAMIPVFTHLALVLMLGLWIPPFLADWYRSAARLIG